MDISSARTRINDNPVAELRLVLASSSRSPYSTRTRALIDPSGRRSRARLTPAPRTISTGDIDWRAGEVTAPELSLVQPSGDELPLRTFDATDVDRAGLQGLADRLPELD